jgi:hypothetical protein
MLFEYWSSWSIERGGTNENGNHLIWFLQDVHAAGVTAGFARCRNALREGRAVKQVF